MKAAIVEAFRDRKTILIATESGAEGINLQFCSLIVNFDLPWNPQRVEQRIGRCHRYGQKIDVLVVNLLNLKNRAEERVFQLLESKFKLFEGVFGVSDEVLGAIESGNDFAKRVFEIHQSARTNEEIDAEFDQLTRDLSESIKADTLDARGKLLGFFDQDVVRLLKDRKNQLARVLGEFEERLIAIARAELPAVAFTKHTDGSPCFDYEGETWTTGWPLADEMGWKFFRLTDGNLASELVGRAKSRQLPVANLRFGYRDYDNGQLADVKALIGRTGWLRVSKLALKTAQQTVEQLLVSARADDGAVLDEQTIDRLFRVPASATAELGFVSPEAELAALEAAGRARLLKEAEDANARFLMAETDKLDAYADDLEKAAEVEIKALEVEIKSQRKALRGASALTVGEKVEGQRAIKKLETRRDELMFATFERKKEIQREMEQILDSVQASLKLVPSLDPLFTVRWEVQA
jgi:hypothetical protein